MSTPGFTTQDRAQFVRQTKEIVIEFPDVNSNASDTAPSGDKYSQLTTRQYRAFMDTYRGTASESTAISFGFRVVGNMLRQIPVAYADYLAANTDETHNPKELETTLLGSFKTSIGSIARLDRDRSEIYETWLGLFDGSDPGGTATAYRFLRYQSQLYFEPKMRNLDQIDAEIGNLNRAEGYLTRPKSGCPALKFVLPKLWDVDITGCIADPNYFANDIKTRCQQIQTEADTQSV